MNRGTRSPYSLDAGPFSLSLLHATRRVVVSGHEIGPAGAPYPERRVVCGGETGWADNGEFHADATFPRRVTVTVGEIGEVQHHQVVGLAVGDPAAAFPAHMVVLFRWDAMEVGFVRPGSRTFQRENVLSCALPFAGLEKEDLDRNSWRPLSAAAWRAMKAPLSTVEHV